jgi:hypothetical protein
MTAVAALFISALFIAPFIGGCKKDKFVETVGVCPLVASTDPANLAIDVPLNKIITATFNEKMDPVTITTETFTLGTSAKGEMLVAGTVTYANLTASFTPSVALTPLTTYTGTIKAGVRDLLRNALQADYKWTFTTMPVVTLSSNPAAGGTTNGAGTFAKGSVVTVVATPNAGYTFTNWTDGATIVSTSSSYQFTMSGNRTLVANFTIVPAGNFAINLSSNPVAGGTTNGAGSFSSGSTVTVTALPNPLYSFANWTDAGTIISTSSSYTFTLSANRTLVANYNLIPGGQFAVILSSIPAAGGTTSGSGAFNAASSVTVTATPNTGYHFVNWTDAGTIVSTSSSYTFTLNANRTLVANFAVNTYTLNVTAVNGTVAKNPDQATYIHGSTVQLTATANAGCLFTSWSGDATGAINPLTVTMDANKNITANFTQTFTLNVTAVNGTVVKNPALGPYNNGTTVTLTATPDAGYTFTSWSGDFVGIISPATILMNANKNITANFTPIAAVCPTIVDLGLSGDYVILAQSGISTTGLTSVTGNMGISPAAATLITGFGLILPPGGAFSTSSLVTGNIYAPGYADPTPANLTTAINNMQTAYTTANGLVIPAPVNELLAGNLNSQTLVKGIYKWSSNVDITVGITLDGGGDPCATWIFQIAGDLTVANGAIITLINGAEAKNIFWVVAGSKTALGTTVDFSGNILCKTLISLNTGAKVTGRLLAQTAVTLNASTVILP